MLGLKLVLLIYIFGILLSSKLYKSVIRKNYEEIKKELMEDDKSITEEEIKKISERYFYKFCIFWPYSIMKLFLIK